MARVLAAVAATSTEFKLNLKDSVEVHAVPMSAGMTAIVSWLTLHNVRVSVFGTKCELIDTRELKAYIYGTIDRK